MSFLFDFLKNNWEKIVNIIKVIPYDRYYEYEIDSQKIIILQLNEYYYVKQPFLSHNVIAVKDSIQGYRDVWKPKPIIYDDIPEPKYFTSKEPLLIKKYYKDPKLRLPYYKHFILEEYSSSSNVLFSYRILITFNIDDLKELLAARNSEHPPYAPKYLHYPYYEFEYYYKQITNKKMKKLAIKNKISDKMFQ